MKIVCDANGEPVKQGEVDWMLNRSGIPTASEFDALVTPEFSIRKGEMPKTYLHKKVAEAWQGGPLIGFNVFDVEQGKILESEAKPWFALEYGIEIKSVGFITTDDGRVGCSPDGLIGENAGIEIKCPAVHTHVGYVLKGELPKEYAAQVHGSMFVTGASEWTFLSYRRHFPPLVLKAQRDDKIIAAIEEALELFLEAFDTAMIRMHDINGGPPRRRAVTSLDVFNKPEKEMSMMPS